MRAALESNGLDAVGARLLRQQPRTPTPPSARRSTRTCARASTPPPTLGGVPGRHVHRPRPRPQRRREPARGRARLPAARRLRRRARRAADDRELRDGGLAPRRLPGNLAYSPELWEWMFDLGLYLNFDPSHLLWLGHRPGRGAASPTSTASPTRTPRTPRRSPSSATATASSAAPRPASRTRGTWAGGATGSRASATSTSAATSTRSTRAASTACCRSSTRTRSGAARRRRSSRACGSPTHHLRPMVVAMTADPRGPRAGQGVPRRQGAAGRRPRRRAPARSTACSAPTAPASRRSSSASPARSSRPRGEILFEGEPLPVGDPAGSLKRGVATIYQELDLVEDLTVAESIFLGHEPRRGPLLDRDKMDARRRRAARAPRPRRRSRRGRRSSALRPAAQQIVSIARALSGDVRPADHGRAVGDPRRGGDRDALRRRAPPHRRGRRRHLHLAPPRRDPPHRQPRDRARRRPHDRDRHPGRRRRPTSSSR